MIEIILYNYLKTALNVPVYTEYPETATDLNEFVVISKVDAGETNYIKAATFLCEIYAASMYESAALAEIVKSKMYAAIELDEISAVKIGGDRPSNDTQRKQYKYDCIFNLFHY